MSTARGPVRFVDIDWAALDRTAQVAHLATEGYVVLPQLLDSVRIEQVRAELADLPMNVAPYSPEQKFAKVPPQWHSRSFAELIGHPPLVAFLRAALGAEITFMLGHYVITGAGVPGLSLHSDYQPFGSPAKGWEESSPATIRVLIYMDELTVERGAFTILPRSHAAIHEEANPYVRYDHHPDMVTLPMRAGDAVAFNVKAFHGTHPYIVAEPRGMIELAYRPDWARCAGPVKEWEAADLAAAPEAARPFLRPRNGGIAEQALGTLVDARKGGFAGLVPPAPTEYLR